MGNMTLTGLMETATMYPNRTYEYLWQDIDIDARLDKNILIQEILLSCSNSIPYINNVEMFKNASDSFFLKWKYQISKLLDTQEFKYNPIWNKDGVITENHNSERIREVSVTDDYGETENTTDDSTSEKTVSAYNESDYQPYDKDKYDDTRNKKIESGRDTDTHDNDTLGEVTKRVEQGNIGVTTTQSMIVEERSLYEFNIYEWIVTKYEKELFMRVW